jgi:hypothetical protein
MVYINDLPTGINLYATPVIHVEDTSMLTTPNTLNDSQTKLNSTLTNTSVWFSASGLSLYREDKYS